jgi:plastocyanin
MTNAGGRGPRRTFGLAALLALAAVSCGGGSVGSIPSTPSSPSSPASPAATPDPATTITITSAGVSPKQITVAVGARVTFINNDNTFHEMQSDPHPLHTDCPEINAVGALGAGRSGQTASLTRARTCGYHDHGQDTNTALQGTIVVR